MHLYNFGHFGLNIMWPNLAKAMIDRHIFKNQIKPSLYVNSKVL